MTYVYILRCSDGSLYTGWTTDLGKRIETHNQGKGAKYTRSRLPAELVYHEEYEDRQDAMKRECEIKKLSRQQKLKLIAADEVKASSPPQKLKLIAANEP